MPTARGFTRKAFQCGLYEAQDVLIDVDDVDLLFLEPRAGFHLRKRWQRQLLYRDVTRRLAFVNPGLQQVRVTRDYDLFLAVCQNYWDLLYINAVDGWKDRCRTSVCWLDELWVAAIPEAKYWLHLLQQFDHVFLGCRDSVAAVSQAIGRVCHWLPGGVDVLRFGPYPEPPARVIDVYSIGRRWEAIHQRLRRRAADTGMFYVYDTCPGSDLEPFDHGQHRELIANVARRSRYFVVAPAKMDLSTERAAQSEVGYRYFEGAAAGAVMIGQTPTGQSYDELFDWPDAVIEIAPDGSDLDDVLDAMNAQPERLESISRRNAAQALCRHDWVYRWKRIFDMAGLSLGCRATARLQRLRELARMATDPVWSERMRA